MRSPRRPGRTEPETTDVALRRIDWVRVYVDGRRMWAEAVGVAFRLPAVCAISLATAGRLIAAGTPHVTHRLGSSDGR